MSDRLLQVLNTYNRNTGRLNDQFIVHYIVEDTAAVGEIFWTTACGLSWEVIRADENGNKGHARGNAEMTTCIECRRRW